MRKRILAVDDSEAVRQAHFDLLTRAGYSVSLAGDGRDALSKLRSFTPDLIVLDINMPGLNGWEFLELAEREVDLDKIPVVILSGLPETSEQARQMVARYACYVTKKASGSDLLQIIAEIFEQQKIAAKTQSEEGATSP
ncbi:MAG: response regulator [Armatimonadota bacterium]